jgi:hypothetical protein
MLSRSCLLRYGYVGVFVLCIIHVCNRSTSLLPTHDKSWIESLIIEAPIAESLVKFAVQYRPQISADHSDEDKLLARRTWLRSRSSENQGNRVNRDEEAGQIKIDEMAAERIFP